MPQKIDYGDNIFFLSMKARTLKDSVKLELQTDLLLEPLNREILFLVKTTQYLFQQLKESSHIRNRAEHLRDIRRLINTLIEFFMEIEKGETSLSTALRSESGEYRILEKELENSRSEASELLTIVTGSGQEERYTISEEEYKILLSEEDQ